VLAGSENADDEVETEFGVAEVHYRMTSRTEAYLAEIEDCPDSAILAIVQVLRATVIQCGERSITPDHANYGLLWIVQIIAARMIDSLHTRGEETTNCFQFLASLYQITEDYMHQVESLPDTDPSPTDAAYKPADECNPELQEQLGEPDMDPHEQILWNALMFHADDQVETPDEHVAEHAEENLALAISQTLDTFISGLSNIHFGPIHKEFGFHFLVWHIAARSKRKIEVAGADEYVSWAARELACIAFQRMKAIRRRAHGFRHFTGSLRYPQPLEQFCNTRYQRTLKDAQRTTELLALEQGELNQALRNL
jgi:hypothetical protein